MNQSLVSVKLTTSHPMTWTPLNHYDSTHLHFFNQGWPCLPRQSCQNHCQGQGIGEVPSSIIHEGQGHVDKTITTVQHPTVRGVVEECGCLESMMDLGCAKIWTRDVDGDFHSSLTWRCEGAGVGVLWRESSRRQGLDPTLPNPS